MLKKKIQVLYAEIGEEYNNAEKKAIVSYVLMDPEERFRVHLPRIPTSFKVFSGGLKLFGYELTDIVVFCWLIYVV